MFSVLATELGDRYIHNSDSKQIEVSKSNRQITTIDKGTTLRIIAPQPFKLRWSNDDWSTKQDLESTQVSLLDFSYVDLTPDKQAVIQFSFYCLDSNDWGQTYSLKVV